MPQSTSEDLAWAKSGKKPITIVRWSGGGRLVKNQKQGRHLVQVWKRWHERKGWRVIGTQEWYRAYPPGVTVGVMALASHCAMLTYHRNGDIWGRAYSSPLTLERIK